MSTREFEFIGFLSANKKEKEDKLEQIKYDTRTLIFYEAPHKLKSTIESMIKVLGDRKVVLARELTKVHEEYIRGNLSTILEQMVEIKGEFVVIIEGNSVSKKDFEINQLNEKTLEEHYNYYEEKGFEKKDIIKKIAKDRNTNKNEIYQYFLEK